MGVRHSSSVCIMCKKCKYILGLFQMKWEPVFWSSTNLIQYILIIFLFQSHLSHPLYYLNQWENKTKSLQSSQWHVRQCCEINAHVSMLTCFIRDSRVTGLPHNSSPWAPRAVRGLVPCSRTLRQHPGGELAPLQLPVHTLEPTTLRFLIQVSTHWATTAPFFFFLVYDPIWS